MTHKYSIATVAGFALLAALYPATLQAQEVKISWAGQACYVFEGGGATVIVDPFLAGIGYDLPTMPANVVTISHNHPDHNNSGGIKGDFTLLDGRPVVERTPRTAAGLSFVQIPGFHDDKEGATFGRNTIIRWTQGGLHFAHLGDYGQARLTAEQLSDLRDVDVAFLPAGGFFTIDAKATAALIKEFNPRVAVLMHFRTGLGGPAQLAAFPAIAEPFPHLKYKPGKVTLSRANLPSSQEIWLMEVATNVSVVNAASSEAGVPVAPGSLASAYGAFTGAERQAGTALPLERKLGKTEVLVGGKPAPMVFSSNGQVNFQVSAQETPGQKLVEVQVGGERVARGSVTILDRAPGLFLVLNQDGTLNSPSNPARRGQVIQIFGTGQGSDLTQPVADGAAAPASPLARTNEEPGVFIWGRRQEVKYSGLVPGAAGVWQINAAVANDAQTGPNVSLVVHSGLASNELTIAVQ